MNERNPIFLLGMLVDKIERQDELIEALFTIIDLADVEFTAKIQLQELRAFISADCDRLYAALNVEFSPLHVFNTLSREQSNKYLDFTELINEKPEGFRK